MVRYAAVCDPDRAWVPRDLWTGSFDVRSIVPAAGNVGGSEHLNPLIGHMHDHVLGRIPQEASVTESTEQDIREREMFADRLNGI